jgi:hypothetical protein
VDLAISPDLSALCCYTIVAILGAWVAGRQISERLRGIPGVWLEWRTYLLFLLYAMLPMGLFWLLDRGGAAADTSVFAAVLVGVGYQQIIAGKNETIRAPGDLSQFWTPFVSYADSIAQVVRRGRDTKQRRIEDRIIAGIAADDEKLRKFIALARGRLPDAESVDTQLEALNSKVQFQGVKFVTERKVRLLLGLMLSVPDRYRLMYQESIIGWWEFRFRLFGDAGSSMAWLAAALPVLALLGLFYWGGPYLRAVEPRYYLWRVAKANATPADLYRSRLHLASLIGDENRGTGTLRGLGVVLRNPTLPMDRVDLILQTMLEAYSAGVEQTVETMVATLHASNVDTRRRVHDALLPMAASCATKTPASLLDWKPAGGDSAAVLETNIEQWKAYWASRPCLVGGKP